MNNSIKKRLEITNEDEMLLLKDLLSKLPYGVRVSIITEDTISVSYPLIAINNKNHAASYEKPKVLIPLYVPIDGVRPYLRPMSSVTEKENKEIQELYHQYFMKGLDFNLYVDAIDWLNEHMFDYRGLIEKGLALEAPENMYRHFGDMKTVVVSVEHHDKF